MAFKYVSYDTLNELVTLIKNALATKVNTDGSKVLSDNNYTTIEKNKLASINADAAANVIEAIQMNNVALDIVSKTVNIPMASATTDGILAKTDYAKLAGINDTIRSEVSSALDDITGISFEIVTTLPTTGNAGTVYLVKDAVNGAGDNTYKEYIYVAGAYEMLGTTAVDLTNYPQNSDFTEITKAELEALWK